MAKKGEKLGKRWPLYSVEDGFILSKKGDVTFGFQVDLPEIFTLSMEDYKNIHSSWTKAIKSLPEHTIVHKQDWFLAENYYPEPREADSYLQKAYKNHFYERPYLDHTCFLYITHKPKNRAKVNSGNSNLFSKTLPPDIALKKAVKDQFIDDLKQMQEILESSGHFKLRGLSSDEICGTDKTIGTLEQYVFLKSPNQNPLLDDIILNGSVQIGDNKPEIYSLADLEHLPEFTGPRITYDEYSSDKNKFSIGFATTLGLLLDCNHVYNQYLYIDDQKKIVRDLERKVNSLHSFSEGSRYNAITRDSVNEYLNEYTTEHQRPVRAHFNLIAWGNDQMDNQEIRNKVSSAISKIEATPKIESVAAGQLYWAGIPGNEAELPLNDTFLTFVDQAVCFFNNETNYRSSKSPLGLKLGERISGKPVHIDLSDEPWRKGIINNRNKFVLGPSGSGKSFIMNKIMSSYYDDGAHIVLIDVGDSYQGLCKKVGGYYFTYQEDDPIQFNPFYISENDNMDTEKKESLKALLLSLWKKDAGDHTRSEYVGLSNSLRMYYEYLEQNTEVFPCFNSYYEFIGNNYKDYLEKEKVRDKEFDIKNYLYNLEPYYKGGEFDYLLNATENLDIMDQRFIVFELDNIKDHPILFPVVTLMIMEIFINKMRKLKGLKKIIAIEEAWKAIAKEGMAEYIKYLFKTVRKFNGEAIVVTQEVEDILSSPIVKNAIINNSDCKILLDQSKFENKFQEIEALLGLTNKETQQVLSINKNNDPTKKYREVFISLGGTYSRVYRTEVSLEEYLTFTTEKTEKVKLFEFINDAGGNYDLGLKNMARAIRSKELNL